MALCKETFHVYFCLSEYNNLYMHYMFESYRRNKRFFPGFLLIISKCIIIVLIYICISKLRR